MTLRAQYPEPTAEQLQAALDRLHATAPAIWPRTMRELVDKPNAKKLVRARAFQAMGQSDMRSREQLALECSRPDGSPRIRRVWGLKTNQLALGEEFK